MNKLTKVKLIRKYVYGDWYYAVQNINLKNRLSFYPNYEYRFRYDSNYITLLRHSQRRISYN